MSRDSSHADDRDKTSQASQESVPDITLGYGRRASVA